MHRVTPQAPAGGTSLVHGAQVHATGTEGARHTRPLPHAVSKAAEAGRLQTEPVDLGPQSPQNGSSSVSFISKEKIVGISKIYLLHKNTGNNEHFLLVVKRHSWA